MDIDPSCSNPRIIRGGGIQRINHTMLRSARQWSSSFWTRTALVLILALSVMATALFVLRLYHATVYEEAAGLGKDLQQEVANMAHLSLAAFIGDMAPGVLVLAGNLHRLGMVDIIARDPHDVRPRKMLWETFAARPLAEGLSYGTDMGAEIFARPFPGATPTLIEAQPQNPAAPFEGWTARFMPVDAVLGEPLYPGPVPAVPFVRFTSLDHHVQAHKQPPGTIHWWTGPIRRTDTGEFLMHYIASSVLVTTANAASANDSSPCIDNSTLTTGPPQVIGTVGMAYSTRSLSESFQQLNLRGGRLFLSRAEGGMLVIASQGRLFIRAEGAEIPHTITAELSDDPIIAAAARHLLIEFSGTNDPERAVNAARGEQEDAAHAAAAGLCWEAYQATKDLEVQVEKQEGEIQNMAEELNAMVELLPRGSRNAIDLRTPMEKVHDLLAGLADASGAPRSGTLATIQKLLRMPELHMPMVLQRQMGRGTLESGSPRQQAGQDSQVLDDDVTLWLRSTVMRLPSATGARLALSRGDAMHWITADGSSGSGSSHLNSDESTFQPSLSFGEIQNTVCDVVGLSAPNPIRQEPLLLEWDQEGGMPSADKAMPGTVSSAASEHALQQMGAPPDAPDTNGGHKRMHRQLRAMLDRAGEWNFDSWALLEVSAGQPILWMGLEVLRRMSLVRQFHLPMNKLVKFLSALDEGMPSNSYHNSTHIADVTNSLFHLLKASGVGAYLTRLDMLAVITAALVHDFRHPGLNNDFVVKSSDDLALRYNDLAVLENYHVSEAFFLMAEVDLNILEGLNKDDFKYLRRIVIEIVLASDLKRHFELVEAFKARTKDKGSPLSKSNEVDRLLLMKVALKVADIGHSAKKLDIHKKWTDAITEEFYLQGDRERAAGLQVSPFMDRENNNLAKSQVLCLGGPCMSLLLHRCPMD
eukprot:jgi/Mesvir1/18861/Mv10515-RA.1